MQPPAEGSVDLNTDTHQLCYKWRRQYRDGNTETENCVLKQNIKKIRYQPPHVESCPPVWRNRDKCFRRIFYPERG